MIYEGEFYDGQFHGNGTMLYPNGNRIIVTSVNGTLQTMKLVYADESEFDINDKEYVVEPKQCSDYDCPPITDEIFKCSGIGDDIPPGCYDTLDGYYNPKTKCIHDKKHFKIMLRIITAEEEQFIMKYCAKATTGVNGFPSSISLRIPPDFDYLNEKNYTEYEGEASHVQLNEEINDLLPEDSLLITETTSLLQQINIDNTEKDTR